ncbi:hypothetical protein, partial [Burkholderia sp. LMG 13014]|uniref:hypothetical protein n=1 Tax=Burkholderia sp. LMG 13014 TaxID=2709306 RepID=UPI001964C804
MVHGINIEVSFRQFYIDGGGSFYHPPVSPNDGNARRQARQSPVCDASQKSVDTNNWGAIISLLCSKQLTAKRAQVAELVDALGSGPSGGN